LVERAALRAAGPTIHALSRFNKSKKPVHAQSSLSMTMRTRDFRMKSGNAEIG
jgi:hypothetical protein